MEDNRKQNVEVVTIAGPGPLGLKLVAFNSQGEEENLNAKVASVKPNSNAYKARVFPGALIFAVNGVSVEGLRYNEVLTKIKQASQSRPFDLTLKKPNKLIEFSRKIEEGKNLRKAGNNLNNNNHHNIDGKNIITSSTKSKDPIETNKKVSNLIEPSPSSSPALNISPEISNNKKTVPTSINDTTFNNNNNNMEQHNKINITTTNKNGINRKTQSSSSEDVSKLNTTIQSLNNQIKSLNLQLDNQTNATTNLSKKFIKEKRQLEESNKLLNENLTQINTHNESLKVQVEKDSQTLINKQNEINMLQEEVSKLKATITDIESSKNKSIAEKKADSEMELMETKEKLMEYEVENKTLIGQTEILELQVKDANTDNENLNSKLKEFETKLQSIKEKNKEKIETLTNKYETESKLLKDNISVLSSEKEDLMEMVVNLETQSKQALVQLENTNQSAETYSNETANLKKEIERLKVDYNAKLEKQMEKYNKFDKHCREQIKNIIRLNEIEVNKFQNIFQEKIITQKQRINNITIDQVKSLIIEKKMLTSELKRTKEKLNVARRYELEYTELQVELQALKNFENGNNEKMKSVNEQILTLNIKIEKKDEHIAKQNDQIESFKTQIKQLKSMLKKVKNSPVAKKLKRKNSMDNSNTNIAAIDNITSDDDNDTIIMKLKAYVTKQNEEITKLKAQITKSWQLRKKMEATHESSKKSILEQQKRLVNDQKRVMSRLRSSENSIQRSVEESKQQFRKEKKHLSEVINALVRSKQELQLKYDVVLKKLSLQNISSKKKILTNNINNSPVTTTPIRSNNSNYNKKSQVKTTSPGGKKANSNVNTNTSRKKASVKMSSTIEKKKEKKSEEDDINDLGTKKNKSFVLSRVKAINKKSEKSTRK